MNSLFIFFAVAGLCAVFAILLAGIFVMAKGGKADRERSNRLMRWRVMAQGIVVFLLVLGALLFGKGN